MIAALMQAAAELLDDRPPAGWRIPRRFGTPFRVGQLERFSRATFSDERFHVPTVAAQPKAALS
jgi:hypothetical protein